MSIFFNWLQSFCLVKLQCSFPSLCNMEETSKELHYFSIGIDLLGPDPTSNKNKAGKKLASCMFCKFVGRPAAANFGRKLDQMFLLKPKYKMWCIFDQPIGMFVYFFCALLEFCTLSQ